MSCSVTPGRSATAGSTSRGTARSSTTSRRPARLASTGATSTSRSTVPAALVALTTASAVASAAGSSASASARPATRPAPPRARACGWRRRSGPRRAVRRFAEHPLGRLAGSDDDDVLDWRRAARLKLVAQDRGVAEPIEAAPREMPVRARAFLPIDSAWWNRRPASGRPAGLAGGVQRVAHLPEDLRLPEQLRLEPGRDREQVGRRVEPGPRREAVDQLFFARAGRGRQADDRVRHVRAGQVNLGPVAGRQDRGLARDRRRWTITAGRSAQAAASRSRTASGAATWSMPTITTAPVDVEGGSGRGHSAPEQPFCEIVARPPRFWVPRADPNFPGVCPP